MACLDPQQLSDLVAGRLSDADAAALGIHARNCETCTARLAAAHAEPGRFTLAVGPDDVPTAALGQNKPKDVQPPRLAAGTAIGRYMIVKHLGEGGMGVVYAAIDPELDRKVALKMLQAQPGGGANRSEGHARLLREAQAMARLNHPNVAAVFDVGTLEDRVFLAMEFVDGQNLREWMNEAKRPWRASLALLLDAGRGLAAAHDAGLVHRDVKPDNVLVGKDGRVRVTDFGLARSSAAGEPDGHLAPPSPASADENTPSPKGLLITPLTQHGAVLGTPAYMAPEQFRGQPADARTDQYSYAVMLYEALYGERPFDSLQRQMISRGVECKPKDAPRDSPIPAWLRRIVLKGLAFSPEARFGSIAELLVALGRDPWISRRRWALVGAGAAVALAAIAALRLSAAQQARVCQDTLHRLDGVWDPASKGQIRQAFEGIQQPFASTSWRAVEKALDAYAQDWGTREVEACELSRKGGEVAELPLLQRVCLQQRLLELKALTGIFKSADAKVVEKAAEATTALPSLAMCSGANLRQPVKPAQTAQARTQVAAQREKLAQARAYDATGKYKEGIALAEAALAVGREVNYAPLRAEALDILGGLQKSAGEIAVAAQTLQEAELAAEASRFEEIAAEAAVRRVYALYLLSQLTAAREWARRGQAYIDRMGGDDRLQGDLYNNLGSIALDESRFDESQDNYQKAIALREKVYGPRSVQVVKSLDNLARLLHQRGDLEGAAATARRFGEILRETVGPDHPVSISSGSTITLIMVEEGLYEEVRPLAERLLAARLQHLGPAHYLTGETNWTMGNVLRGLGEYDQALPYYQRCAKIFSDAYGPEDPLINQLWADQIDTLELQGKHAEALEAGRRNRLVLEKRVGPNDYRIAWSLIVEGDSLRSLGRPAEALEVYQRCQRILGKALGEQNPQLGRIWAAVGQAEWALGHPERAIPALERALALTRGHQLPREDDGDARFALAQALVSRPEATQRALGLAREAREAYSHLPLREAAQIRRVEAWISRHSDAVSAAPTP